MVEFSEKCPNLIYFFFLAVFFFAGALAVFFFVGALAAGALATFLVATFLAAAFLTALAGAFLAGAALPLVFLPFPKAEVQPVAYFSLVPTRVIVTCINLSQHLKLHIEPTVQQVTRFGLPWSRGTQHLLARFRRDFENKFLIDEVDANRPALANILF